jgi:hypothetical protein
MGSSRQRAPPQPDVTTLRVAKGVILAAQAEEREDKLVDALKLFKRGEVTLCNEMWFCCAEDG